MKTPVTLLETREALGMSQQAFARLLNISRSQLAMAETGRRQLPAAASTLLLEIQQEMYRDAGGLVAGLLVGGSKLPETGSRLDNSLRQAQADISAGPPQKTGIPYCQAEPVEALLKRVEPIRYTLRHPAAAGQADSRVPDAGEQLPETGSRLDNLLPVAGGSLRRAQGDSSLQSHGDSSLSIDTLRQSATAGKDGSRLPDVDASSPLQVERLTDSRLLNLAGRCRQDAIRCRKMARQLQKNQVIEARRQQLQPLMAKFAKERPLSPTFTSKLPRQSVTASPPSGSPNRLLEAARYFEAIAALLEA